MTNSEKTLKLFNNIFEISKVHQSCKIQILTSIMGQYKLETE